MVLMKASSHSLIFPDDFETGDASDLVKTAELSLIYRF